MLRIPGHMDQNKAVPTRQGNEFGRAASQYVASVLATKKFNGKKMTQKALAAKVGMSKDLMSDFVLGKQTILADDLLAILDALEVEDEEPMQEIRRLMAKNKKPSE